MFFRFSYTTGEDIWVEPKFTTICWFLTIQAHHIALIPAISTYTRLLRHIRELQKMIGELAATESIWSQTGNADRNRRLVKRWKNDLKVAIELL